MFDRFQWVFCQLEALRHCLPIAIWQTLSELPDSLDETFERILKGIKISDRDLAHRLLQCLSVAFRPLHVKELAELRANDFDGAEGATSKLIKDNQSEDPLEDVLSICSSLIMVVDTGHSRVVQFSHFSVKEFLTSDRLATSKRDISQFHVAPEAAHMTLTQVCLATLLQFHDSSSNDEVERNFPLAGYASQHWVEHAQSGLVSLRIKDRLTHLFDSTRPQFATWLWSFIIDDHWNQFDNAWVARGSPLYYASLCGFRRLAEHIIKGHPEQVNAKGGRRHGPLAAALYRGHFRVADLLHQHGAVVNVPDHNNQTLLQAASADGRIDFVRWLLDHGADTNSQPDDHGTPIHLAASNGHPEVIQALLEHNAYTQAVDKGGRTPLHLASSSGKAEIVRLLLEHGADPNAVDSDGWTPLNLTWTAEVESLLMDYGASPDEGSSTSGVSENMNT